MKAERGHLALDELEEHERDALDEIAAAFKRAKPELERAHVLVLGSGRELGMAVLREHLELHRVRAGENVAPGAAREMREALAPPPPPGLLALRDYPPAIATPARPVRPSSPQETANQRKRRRRRQRDR